MNEEKIKDTVGTAVPTNEKHPKGVTYGEAIEHLRRGGVVSRHGWNGSGMYVFKQVPSKVPKEIIHKMSSLPEKVKTKMIESDTFPYYQNQMSIVDSFGKINSWLASSSDTFADDWVLS